MATQQLTEPCWVVALADGDQAHFTTSKAAHDWITPDIAHHVSHINVAGQPCWTATCNTCGQAELDENGHPMHFDTATPSDLGDLQRGPDGRLLCQECRPLAAGEHHTNSDIVAILKANGMPTEAITAFGLETAKRIHVNHPQVGGIDDIAVLVAGVHTAYGHTGEQIDAHLGLSAPRPEQHTGTLNLTGHGKPQDSAADPMAEIADWARVVAHRIRTDLKTADCDSPTWLALMENNAKDLDKLAAKFEAAAPAIRKQVAEQIAAKLDERHRANLALTGGDDGVPREGRVGLATGYQRAAEMAREIGRQA